MIPWVPLGNVIFSLFFEGGKGFAQIAQLVEQWTENPRVAGSIPALGTTFAGTAQPLAALPFTDAACPICGHSSSGRAPPCQGGGSEFEPRCPLQKAIPTPKCGNRNFKNKCGLFQKSRI